MKSLYCVVEQTAELVVLTYETEPTVVAPESKENSFYPGPEQDPLVWDMYQPEKGGVSLLNEAGKRVGCLAWVAVEHIEQWNPNQKFFLAAYQWSADETLINPILPNEYGEVGNTGVLMFQDQSVAKAVALAIKRTRSGLRDRLREALLKESEEKIAEIFRSLK